MDDWQSADQNYLLTIKIDGFSTGLPVNWSQLLVEIKTKSVCPDLLTFPFIFYLVLHGQVKSHKRVSPRFLILFPMPILAFSLNILTLSVNIHRKNYANATSCLLTISSEFVYNGRFTLKCQSHSRISISQK